MQMFGSDPEIMAEMARKLNEYEDIDILDINMGCPAPKIVKNGEGSALTLNPKLVGEIISAVSKASEKPVTVKRSYRHKRNEKAFRLVYKRFAT